MANKKYMISNMKLKPIASAVTLAMFVLMDTAYAQEATPKGQLETIVVTANKRVEKLENVPMSISVVNEELIQRNNIREIEDLVALTPAIGMIEGTTNANTSISMRGIGTITNTIGIEADVSVIIDDIPVANQFQAFKDLADVSRIEVLKGPQNTLFGKASVAGALNIVTKPITGPLTARGMLYYTNDGEWRIGASYGGKITDTLGVRIAANNTSYAGPLHNLTTGQDVGGSGGKTFIAKIHWAPTSNLDVDFSPHYNYQTNTKGAGAIFSAIATNGAKTQSEQVGVGGANSIATFYQNNDVRLPLSKLWAGINPAPWNRDIRRDFPTGMFSSDRGAGFKVGYQLPNGATLMSISSFDKYMSRDARDQDFTDVPTFALPLTATTFAPDLTVGDSQGGTYDIRAKTQEFRLVSADTGTVKYVAGLWFAKNEQYRFFNRGLCVAPTACQNGGVATTRNGLAVAAVNLGPSNPVVYDTYKWDVNKAIFGQMSWDFSPTYTLTAGLRDSVESSGYWFARNWFTNLTPETFFINPSGNDYFENPRNTENSITGKLSLQKQFNKEWMGYGTVATGYKGLAYSLLSGLNKETSAPTQHENSQTVELGLKGNLFKNRMSVAAALWNTEFFRYQHSQTKTDPDYPGVTFTEIDSIPRARTRGFEFDTTALVTPEWKMNLAAAYTEATIQLYPNSSCGTDSKNVGVSPASTVTTPEGNVIAIPAKKFAANGSVAGKSSNCFPSFVGDTVGIQDVSGSFLPKAPKVKVTLGNAYDINFASLPFNMQVTGNIKYQSEESAGISGNLNIAPYSIVDLGFSIKEKKDFYKISFVANNVFDKQYTVAGSGQSKAGGVVGSTTTSPTLAIVTYLPARDSFRYFSLKLEMKY